MLTSAVIGAGRIARQHLGALKELDGVALAGLCDLSPATAEATAERYGIPRWFTDHRHMLAEVRPDVVHIVTPAPSHYAIATDVIAAGAHVLVEKPITTSFEEFVTLRRQAEAARVHLLEDHNLEFNPPVQRLLELVRAGDFGAVVHVEVHYCLDILGQGSAFMDRNIAHPALAQPGGAISDFLTHLSYLAYLFAGPHRAVRTIWSKRSMGNPLPSDEFRAMIDGASATAVISFSAHSQPDGVWLWVHGTKMRAMANLYEGRLALEALGGGPKPLARIFSAWRESRAIRRAAVGSLWRKLAGQPDTYEGLWELVRRFYQSLAAKTDPPVSLTQIEHVSRLVADLTREEFRL